MSNRQCNSPIEFTGMVLFVFFGGGGGSHLLSYSSPNLKWISIAQVWFFNLGRWLYQWRHICRRHYQFFIFFFKNELQVRFSCKITKSSSGQGRKKQLYLICEIFGSLLIGLTSMIFKKSLELHQKILKNPFYLWCNLPERAENYLAVDQELLVNWQIITC